MIVCNVMDCECAKRERSRRERNKHTFCNLIIDANKLSVQNRPALLFKDIVNPKVNDLN